METAGEGEASSGVFGGDLSSVVQSWGQCLGVSFFSLISTLVESTEVTTSLGSTVSNSLRDTSVVARLTLSWRDNMGFRG